MTLMLWLLWGCTEDKICQAPSVWKEAIETRLQTPCNQITPSRVKALNLSNWSNPLSNDSILSEFTDLEILTLSDSQISDISFVQKMPNLQVLHLDHSAVRDISPLSVNHQLQELWLDYSPVVELAPLASLSQLSILTLRETKIYDLQPLASLARLSVLDVSNTSVFDLSPLSKTQNLSALSLRNTQVSDIEPLASHSSLELLDMRKNRIRSVDVLSKLSKLQALDCGQNRITSFPSLSSSLQEFRADSNPIVESGCSTLNHLHKVECEKNYLSQQDAFVGTCQKRQNLSFSQKMTLDSLFLYANVDDCNALRNKLMGKVDLRGFPILDLRILEPLPLEEIQLNPEWVWDEFCPKTSSSFAVFKFCTQHKQESLPISDAFLSMCAQPDTAELAQSIQLLKQELDADTCPELWDKLSSVSKLEISRKNLRDLRPLQFFSNLKALYLDYNDIRDLSPLSNLSKLQILWVDDNQITDISVLKNNSHMLWLGAGDNQIEDISALAGLSHLRRLWLGGNAIADIRGLQNLRHMRKLHLAFNSISDISPLKYMPDLENVYLAENQITDVTPLQQSHRLQFLNTGLDYQESPLEAHQWFLRNNPITQCPESAPLPVMLACAYQQKSAHSK